MFIETWVTGLFVLLLFGIAFCSLAGWIYEGIKLEKVVEDNIKLHYEKESLIRIIERKNKEATIREANAFSEEMK